MTVNGGTYLHGLSPSFTTSDGVVLTTSSGLALASSEKTMGADGFGT